VCGLAGWAGRVDIDAPTLQRMCSTLVHRGPDAEGSHVEAGRVGLGFRRLSIVDLQTGEQPLYNEDRTIAVTCNGEIYNAPAHEPALRARGHRLSSGSDVEVVSHLYEEHGMAFLEQLHGMFAIALWDARSATLLLARDRMGVKPLYWARVPGGIVYGSDPRAILASGLIAPAPDLEALGQYLTLQYVPPPLSGFAGIRKLAPGEVLTFRDGVTEVTRWWRLSAAGVEVPRDPEEAIDRLDVLMREATVSRLRSDVPLGAFLSGGVDSSLVVAYMAAELPQVRTFSADFPVAAFSEGQHARRVAAVYGTDHEEFIVEPDIVGTLGSVVEQLGEPFADSSAVPTYLLSQMTSARVTVALSGDGGDEAFAGYERYMAALAADRLGPIARPLCRLGSRAMPVDRGGVRTHRARIALQALRRSPHERYAAMVAHFTPEAVAAMILPGAEQMLTGSRHAWSDVLRLPAVAGVDRYTLLDVDTYLPGDLLLKVDRMSMAHSLEVRSPLLDHRVHEFAAAVPSAMKIRRGRLKWPLKALAQRRGLPEDLVHRRKQGFGIPIGPWFRNELRPWLVDVLTDPRTVGRGYFHQPVVDGLIDSHTSGRADHTQQLWNLVMLELWHRSLIDAAA
jgi:asparagine synthase (glutamine-hydrolysing)